MACLAKAARAGQSGRAAWETPAAGGAPRASPQWSGGCCGRRWAWPPAVGSQCSAVKGPASPPSPVGALGRHPGRRALSLAQPRPWSRARPLPELLSRSRGRQAALQALLGSGGRPTHQGLGKECGRHDGECLAAKQANWGSWGGRGAGLGGWHELARWMVRLRFWPPLMSQGAGHRSRYCIGIPLSSELPPPGQGAPSTAGERWCAGACRLGAPCRQARNGWLTAVDMLKQQAAARDQLPGACGGRRCCSHTAAAGLTLRSATLGEGCSACSVHPGGWHPGTEAAPTRPAAAAEAGREVPARLVCVMLQRHRRPLRLLQQGWPPWSVDPLWARMCLALLSCCWSTVADALRLHIACGLSDRHPIICLVPSPCLAEQISQSMSAWIVPSALQRMPWVSMTCAWHVLHTPDFCRAPVCDSRLRGGCRQHAAHQVSTKHAWQQECTLQCGEIKGKAAITGAWPAALWRAGLLSCHAS